MTQEMVQLFIYHFKIDFIEWLTLETLSTEKFKLSNAAN